MIVTIDGPAGTGKSTAARRLAERLGFEFLNTGAMYRAVALTCLEREIPPHDLSAVAATARSIGIQFRDQKLWLDGRDVTTTIREARVTEVASLVASNPEVRSHLVVLQQRCAHGVSLVTEGRDQGTVVFPHAECKIYLTASAEERTRRRQRELEAQGQQVDRETLLSEILLRDERDETRECAPMRPADDAVIVDTSDLSADEVLEQLVRLVEERRPA